MDVETKGYVCIFSGGREQHYYIIYKLKIHYKDCFYSVSYLQIWLLITKNIMLAENRIV